MLLRPKTRQPKTYGFAQTLYADYLQLFSQSKYAYEMTFQYADLLYKLEKFDDAAKAYESTVLADPKGKYLIDAANDNILAVEEHLKDIQLKSPKPSEAADKPIEIHAQRHAEAFIKPNPIKTANISGIIIWVTPPPRFPQPAVVALAVPTTLGANMVEVWNWVITNEAPMTPIASLKSRKLS